jgi:hypothetical protein
MSEENALEIWFDSGETGTCHVYPLTTSFSFDRGWVRLTDKDGAVLAHYNVNAINCIRRTPK